MSLNESVRHSREFMLKAVERLEAGERASALAIELNLNRTITTTGATGSARTARRR